LVSCEVSAIESGSVQRGHTSGLVCKNPAHKLLTAAGCLRRSERDPSIV
jgi:hypothetical protein